MVYVHPLWSPKTSLSWKTCGRVPSRDRGDLVKVPLGQGDHPCPRGVWPREAHFGLLASGVVRNSLVRSEAAERVFCSDSYWTVGIYTPVVCLFDA